MDDRGDRARLGRQILFSTARLCVRPAEPEDAAFIHRLWTCPEVMKFVGYPQGLPCEPAEVHQQIERTQGQAFGGLLIVERQRDGRPIGQAHLSVPGADRICEPDVKLDPLVWGSGYGKELWAALVSYAFEHSDAAAVQGTPNRENAASVRMQCSAGLQKVGEGVFTDHIRGRPEGVSVPYLRLVIRRDQWDEIRETEGRSERRGC